MNDVSKAALAAAIPQTPPPGQAGNPNLSPMPRPPLPRAPQSQMPTPITDETIAAPLASMPDLGGDGVFILTKPIMRVTRQGPEPLSEVRLRQPIALDLFEIGGLPTRTTWSDNGMQIEMNVERVRTWLSRLSGMDGSLLTQLSVRDLRAMYEWLNGELAAAGN